MARGPHINREDIVYYRPASSRDPRVGGAVKFKAMRLRERCRCWLIEIYCMAMMECRVVAFLLAVGATDGEMMGRMTRDLRWGKYNFVRLDFRVDEETAMFSGF